MAENKSRYIHGTSAEKLQRAEYNVYEENKLLKAKKNAKSNAKLKFKMVLILVIVFSMFAFIAYRYSLITDLNYKVNNANITYSNLKNDNQLLKVGIKDSTDLEKIKGIAESRLNMQAPDKAQIIYVSVPERDFTNVSDEYKNSEKKNGVFKTLLEKINEIASFLN